jgi:hypothetical protein
VNAESEGGRIIPEERPLNADGSLRRGRPRVRGRMFRISLDVEYCRELERAAAVRGLDPEVLLNAIGRVVVRERLLDAVLSTICRRHPDRHLRLGHLAFLDEMPFAMSTGWHSGTADIGNSRYQPQFSANRIGQSGNGNRARQARLPSDAH